MKFVELADMGAYYQLLTPGIPELGGWVYMGPYDPKAYWFEFKGVVTNTTPTDAYRGAGRPEATYVIERAMDLFAAEIGMDPADLRRRNVIAPSAFPFTTPVGTTYDIGDYERAQRLLAKYGVSTPEIESVTARLKDIPVDITPVFPAAGEIIVMRVDGDALSLAGRIGTAGRPVPPWLWAP